MVRTNIGLYNNMSKTKLIHHKFDNLVTVIQLSFQYTLSGMASYSCEYKIHNIIVTNIDTSGHS